MAGRKEGGVERGAGNGTVADGVAMGRTGRPTQKRDARSKQQDSPTQQEGKRDHEAQKRCYSTKAPEARKLHIGPIRQFRNTQRRWGPIQRHRD